MGRIQLLEPASAQNLGPDDPHCRLGVSSPLDTELSGQEDLHSCAVLRCPALCGAVLCCKGLCPEVLFYSILIPALTISEIMMSLLFA